MTGDELQKKEIHNNPTSNKSGMFHGRNVEAYDEVLSSKSLT